MAASAPAGASYDRGTKKMKTAKQGDAKGRLAKKARREEEEEHEDEEAPQEQQQLRLPSPVLERRTCDCDKHDPSSNFEEGNGKPDVITLGSSSEEDDSDMEFAGRRRKLPPRNAGRSPGRRLSVVSSEDSHDSKGLGNGRTSGSLKPARSKETLVTRRSTRILILATRAEANAVKAEAQAVKAESNANISKVHAVKTEANAMASFSETANSRDDVSAYKEAKASESVAETMVSEKEDDGDDGIPKDDCVPTGGGSGKKKGRRLVKGGALANLDHVQAGLAPPVSALETEHSPEAESEAAKKVKETLRLFNSYYLRFVQEEEERCRKEAVVESKKGKNTKSKAKYKSKAKNEEVRSKKKKIKDEDSNERHKSRRPDLKAIHQMKADNKTLYNRSFIGHFPGVNAGDQFFSRCEMMAIGLHCHWLAGIDYIGQAGTKLLPGKKFPLASSVMLSGVYEDDIDNSEDVIYTGQGGNNLLGNKRQVADQEMKRGNLALKNSMEEDMPVRLIRGHKTKKSYTGKVYTYDGLYKVKEFWAEKGISGFTVYKFRLRRIEGQPVLTTNQVHFRSGQVPTTASELRGLICADISDGLERIPVPASNVVDNPPFPPTGYKYVATNEVQKGLGRPLPAKGCSCKGECVDVSKCSCAALNGKQFPYVSKNGGRLVEPVDVVYECGPNCGCGAECSNRVTQYGIRYRLEVFKTANKGWGVRSWDTIPPGAPVCEYTGLLMKTADADEIDNNNAYIFELDCLQTMKSIGARQRRVIGSSKENSTDLYANVSEQPEYCVNAGSSGNVARFINHSCEPNLFVQCVLNDHHDLSQTRVWLFAADTIHPLEELTYDYGYEVGSVVKDGNVVVLPCYCGVHGCRKRLH